MYSLGTRLGYEWGHFQEYASSPGQNEKTTGQGDVGGEVRREGDAHGAHARITASGRIGSAPECRVRPMWDIEGVASREAAEDQLSSRRGQEKRREEKRREEMTEPDAAR